MEQFNTLQEAAKLAASRSSDWRFAHANEDYDRDSLLGIAEIHDEENPADEGCFYVVSARGAIGYCLDGESIDWLFLPNPPSGEELPDTYTVREQTKFCSQCGRPYVIGARFCDQCGARLS